MRFEILNLKIWQISLKLRSVHLNTLIGFYPGFELYMPVSLTLLLRNFVLMIGMKQIFNIKDILPE